MAIIIREPRNPLADALGVLSSQILADTAARRERAFRSQEIAAERAYQASENALQREYMKGQNEELLSARAMEHASTLANSRELATIAKDQAIALSNNELEAARALAAAQATGNTAQIKLIEAQIEEAINARRKQDALLSWLGLPGMSGGRSPNGSLSATAVFSMDKNGKAEIPTPIRDTFDLIDPEGDDKLPRYATADEIRGFAQKARKQAEGFGWGSPLDWLGGVDPRTTADALEHIAERLDKQNRENAASGELFRLGLRGAGLGSDPMVKLPE